MLASVHRGTSTESPHAEPDPACLDPLSPEAEDDKEKSRTKTPGYVKVSRDPKMTRHLGKANIVRGTKFDVLFKLIDKEKISETFENI